MTVLQCQQKLDILHAISRNQNKQMWWYTTAQSESGDESDKLCYDDNGYSAIWQAYQT